MITVDEALSLLFDLVAPLEAETVPLRHAPGRVLARGMTAVRAQPPFAASAMDGYAVKRADIASGAQLQVVGEAAAGHVWTGTVGMGQAVRIFTGAPMPTGTDHVVIQENVTRDGDLIRLLEAENDPSYVRPAGADFAPGFTLPMGRVLTPSDITLLAAMNTSQVPVTRKPVVAVIATGDELVQPGEVPRDDQIIASGSYGLAALIETQGALARLLPIARDSTASLSQAFALAQGADLIVTIGGASVGDHDLVGEVAAERGLKRAFYKVAMRPGKPLMAGRLNSAALIGLPGNPVSCMVCGHIFLLPVLRKMLGLGPAPAPRSMGRLAKAIGANGPREHYMRARSEPDGVTVFDRQDSALQSVLAQANCLAVRPPNDPPRPAGAQIEVVTL